VFTTLRKWWEDGETWFAAVGLANLALGTSSVLIPLMVSEILHRSAGAVGILSAMVSLVGVIGSLIWGRLSDAAHRRRPFVVISYAAVGASLAAISLTRAFSHLLLYNMVLNFFWVANAAVTVLIVIENRNSESWERKISHLNQIGAIGWLAGLGLGSGMMVLATRWVGEAAAMRILLGVIALISVLAAFLAARLIPRTTPKFTRRRFRGTILAMGNFLVEKARFAPFHLYHRFRPRLIWAAIRNPAGFSLGTRRFLVATLVAYVALGLFAIPLPLLLAERFAIPSAAVFLFFAIQHVGVVIAYPLAAERIRKRGNRYVQGSALLVRVALFGFTAIYLVLGGNAPSTAVLIIAFLVYGVTWSYFQLSGVALASRLAKPENRGLVLGLYNALAGLGWIIAGLGSSALIDRWGFQAVYAASAGCLVLSLVALVRVPDPSCAAASEASQTGRFSRLRAQRATTTAARAHSR